MTLIGLPWARDFVRRFSSYCDGLLEFPGYAGLPEQPPRPELLPGFFQKARTQGFDLAIQMHGNGTITNGILPLLAARRTAGFFPDGSPCPDPESFLSYPETLPEVQRHLRLLEHLGAEPAGVQLEFPLLPSDVDELRAIGEAQSLRPGEYVCLHAGGRVPSHRWPAPRFAAVADAMTAGGLRVVLTGSADEAGVVGAVIQAMRAPALNLAGRTSLGALGALLRDARLLIANDTGVSHVAAALGLPSVIIFTNSPPARWAPLDATLHRRVVSPAAHPAPPAAVLAQAEALLSTVPALAGEDTRPW